MKLRDKFNGQEYDAAMFDGTESGAPLNADGSYNISLLSPSGDIVPGNVELGTMLIVNPDGSYTAVSPAQIGSQFEEIT